MHALDTSRFLAALALGATACGSVSGKTPDAGPGSDAAGGADAALSWSTFAPVAVDYASDMRTPVVSNDGLTIYFMAQISSPSFDFDIYSAGRASTADNFGVATALLNVNVAGEQVRYPDISDDGLELYYSSGDAGPLMVATRSSVSSAFSTPTAVRSGIAGNFASISGNKLSLYYLVHNAAGSNIDATLMQTTRAAVASRGRRRQR